MDLRSYPGEEDDILRTPSPAFGWEDPDVSSGGPHSLEMSQGDFQEESADSLVDESGPLLRCLKRIYRKAKKEKTRRRRTMASVPDLSAMATIWEENDRPSSTQEPELLLASWRSAVDYFNSKKEDIVMKKSFLRFLSILSKTINWSSMTEVFVDNFTSDVVAAITEMVKKELPEPNVVCLHAMSTIIDLSKGHIMKTMSSYKKGILLRTFFRSVFSLSPMKAGQEEAADLQYTKRLFIGTYQTFSDLLQQLIVENPLPSELERMLQLMTPWLQSPEVDLRERSMWSSASLLNFVATKVKLDTMSKFARLGHLVAVLGICCGDPVKSISSKAAKSVHLLLAVLLGQKIAMLDKKNIHTDTVKQKHAEFLESWNPLVFLKNPSRVAEVFGIYFSPREKTDFILTALDGLTEHSRSGSCATTEGLLASIARHCGPDIEKVSDIVDGVCSRLDQIRRPSARRLVMKLVGLLAGRAEHMDTVISTLLEHTFPINSNSSELWQSLSTEEVVEEHLMENLLRRLKNHHNTEPQVSSGSIAITLALCEVLSVPESTEAIQRLHPELLVTFLDELYFSNQAEALPDTNPLVRKSGQEESLASFAAEAIRLLLLRVGCRYEVTFMEKANGWAMLHTAGEVLQGVALLARALMHFACPEAVRILDLLFSFLGQGNEKLKPTTMAFFVELLHCQDIDQLPAEQIFESLEEWARDPSPDVRSLSLRALGILAIHPDKVEEVKAQTATLLGSLEEAEGRVVVAGLTAIQNILRFMQRNDVLSLAERLLPLFSHRDAKVRYSAIVLFAELPGVVKKKEKYLIQEQVTQSLVPLLLHLQDEEPDVVKACQEALGKCFRFLGWSLPKKISSKKAWHDHPQIAEILCRQIGKTSRLLERYDNGTPKTSRGGEGSSTGGIQKNNWTTTGQSWKVKMIPAVLLQCLDHLQCPQVSIRRAAAIFIGCVAQCTEPAAITQEKKDLIFLSLSKLHGDPDPSVRLAASQATQMVQEACRISVVGVPRTQSQLHLLGSSEGQESLARRGHWDIPDPALTHRWNPASPVSHQIVASNARRRIAGPNRQA